MRQPWVSKNNRGVENARILVVDDRAAVREVLREQLVELGYGVAEACDGEEALRKLKRGPVDLVVSDLRMPAMGGLELLEELKKDGIATVLFSAHADVPTAVDAMRGGAIDFITLPIDGQEFARRISAHVSHAKTRPRASDPAAAGPRISGHHPKMAEVRDRIARVAPRSASVLVTGESGVGKELVAREIHRASGRCGRPFVAVNCCALSENLLESELFGHERGAFSGATGRRIGRFERADGGTLFLDEIGDAPLSTQTKLLRVLQHQEFERVGGLRTIKVDVRIVAATNRNLSELRDRGTFREDLFHRLNVFPVHVPPLRERASDIRELIQSICDSNGIELRFTDAALGQLESHNWPGNVRELENTLRRLEILCERGNKVMLEAVTQAFDGRRGEVGSRRQNFEEDEREQYERLLRKNRWNVSAVARELRVSRGAMRYRLRRHGLLR